MGNEHRHTGGGNAPSTARRLLVAGRWLLAAAGAVAIMAGLDQGSPAVRFAAYAILSGLLANALWQHVPLSRACLTACAASVLFGGALAIYRLATAHIGLEGWLFAALGAVAGAALSYPALRWVDAHSPGIEK